MVRETLDERELHPNDLNEAVLVEVPSTQDLKEKETTCVHTS